MTFNHLTSCATVANCNLPLGCTQEDGHTGPFLFVGGGDICMVMEELLFCSYCLKCYLFWSLLMKLLIILCASCCLKVLSLYFSIFQYGISLTFWCEIKDTMIQVFDTVLLLSSWIQRQSSCHIRVCKRKGVPVYKHRWTTDRTTGRFLFLGFNTFTLFTSLW